MDSFGKTVFELGRFSSDRKALNATKKIILPKRCFLAVRTNLGIKNIALLGERRPKDDILEKLIGMCLASSDTALSELAKEYRYVSSV